MKDVEVPTRKGINVFFLSSTKSLDFTKKCHMRVQCIRREDDSKYIPLNKKPLELGKAVECSSATFAVITRRLPKTLARDFIKHLLNKRGFREVQIRTEGKKVFRYMKAYAPEDANVDEFSERIIVEFRRYVPSDNGKPEYDSGKCVNIVGIPLARSVSSLVQSYLYRIGYNKEFLKYD